MRFMQVSHAKEDMVKEFRDFDAFLYELGNCFADGFNDCLRQVKASFLDMDLSQISIEAMAQTPARLVDLEGTDELFGDDPISDAQGDRGAALQDDQVKSVEDETRPLEATKTIDKEKDEETLVDQP